MQTYYKHGMGETITLYFPITSNGAGVTGQSPVAAVRKKSGQWLNDAKNAWQAGYNDIAMAELDATNLPGVYTLDITHIDLTSEEYQVFFKNTGTYPGIDFESHIFTGAVYIPPTSSYATGTIGGLLTDVRDEALGKWVLDPSAKTLTLYREDGVTTLKTFNLGDTVSDVPVFISRMPTV